MIRNLPKIQVWRRFLKIYGEHESIVGAYLGEAASRLGKLFDYAKIRQCVLFFDEFKTLGKERGDTHETGGRRGNNIHAGNKS